MLKSRTHGLGTGVKREVARKSTTRPLARRAQGTDTRVPPTRVKPFPLSIRSKGCMRRARFKAEASVQVAHYHCVSRVVDRNFVLGELETETFVKLMRLDKTYCGVRVLSFCFMTNHFHILLEVPKRPAPENLPTDHELVECKESVCPPRLLCETRVYGQKPIASGSHRGARFLSLNLRTKN
jgi:hypothetical protein